MSGRGLLSRIASKRPGGAQPLDEVESIVEHLRALLNTRQGEAPTVPDFGIIDFTDLVHSFPDGIQILQRAIRATVLQYEPRLRNVTVRHIRDDEVLILKFEITAQLAQTGSRGILRFRTSMAPGGKIDVR
jgi:type VI secretion system protein